MTKLAHVAKLAHVTKIAHVTKLAHVTKIAHVTKLAHVTKGTKFTGQVSVVCRVDHWWFLAEVDGARGLVPAHCIQVLSSWSSGSDSVMISYEYKCSGAEEYLPAMI